MASVLRKFKPIVVSPTGRHTATAICLHGSGDVGGNFWEWIKGESEGKFSFPHTRFIFPTAPASEAGRFLEKIEGIIESEFSFPHIRLIFPFAPARPYTPMLGQPSTVWFDRKQISPFVAEDLEGIQDSCDDIRKIVEGEIDAGIPPERIIIGGFSMGGALALYYGMRCGLNLAGVFALSAFLGEKSIVYDDLEEDPGPRPPLFQAHGEKDPLVAYQWGVRTHEQLKAKGVQGEFHSFPNLFHELSKKELLMLHAWMQARLPQT